MLTALTFLLLVAALAWLALPPREGQRWALLLGFGLAVGWLLFVAVRRGLAAELGARAPLWLLVLALMGAPLLQLLVWSSVTFLTRRRAPRAPAPPEE